MTKTAWRHTCGFTQWYLLTKKLQFGFLNIMSLSMKILGSYVAFSKEWTSVHNANFQLLTCTFLLKSILLNLSISVIKHRCIFWFLKLTWYAQNRCTRIFKESHSKLTPMYRNFLRGRIMHSLKSIKKNSWKYQCQNGMNSLMDSKPSLLSMTLKVLRNIWNTSQILTAPFLLEVILRQNFTLTLNFALKKLLQIISSLHYHSILLFPRFIVLYANFHQVKESQGLLQLPDWSTWASILLLRSILYFLRDIYVQEMRRSSKAYGL